MSCAGIIRRCHMSTLLKESISECLGTFILLVFGMGSVAQFTLSDGKIGTSDQIRWGWGLGLTFGAYASGASGAQLNPSVTLALCVLKKVPWRKLLPYWLAQYIGAFLAACVVYIINYDALESYKGGNYTIQTAGIFSTYPQDYLSVWNGLADQAFATAMLMFIILSITDDNNCAPPKGVFPIVLGLALNAIGTAFGLNCGFALNPARVLSPRLFTLFAGWGREVFSYNDYKWFWIPVIGPYLGAVLGAFVYIVLIQNKIPLKEGCRKGKLDEQTDLESESQDKLSPLEQSIGSTRM